MSNQSLREAAQQAFDVRFPALDHRKHIYGETWWGSENTMPTYKDKWTEGVWVGWSAAWQAALSQPDDKAQPVAVDTVTDAMVAAYLKAQRETVEEADRCFGRPNIGGLHTNTVREACRSGLSAAIKAAPQPPAIQDKAQPCGWSDDQMERFAWSCINPPLGADSIRERLAKFRACEAERGIAAPQPPAEQTNPTDDHLWDKTISDRDIYHEWADRLAEAIAEHLGVDIGEHSNLNNPWQQAIAAIEEAQPAAEQVKAQPVASSVLGEVIGCFEAALAEGLQEALASTEDERLKDLVERRLMYALDAAQNAAPQPVAREGWKLVPVDPTADMLYEIQENCHILPPRGRRIWAQLLEAAPQPPAEHGEELSDAAARAGGDYGQDTPSNIRNEIIAAVIAADRAARGGAA